MPNIATRRHPEFCGPVAICEARGLTNDRHEKPDKDHSPDCEDCNLHHPIPRRNPPAFPDLESQQLAISSTFFHVELCDQFTNKAFVFSRALTIHCYTVLAYIYHQYFH